jgi:hypothetical protein
VSFDRHCRFTPSFAGVRPVRWRAQRSKDGPGRPEFGGGSEGVLSPGHGGPEVGPASELIPMLFNPRGPFLVIRVEFGPALVEIGELCVPLGTLAPALDPLSFLVQSS